MSDHPERQYSTRYHARWVMPVSADPIPDGTVVVEGDRIAWVGPRDRAPLARDVELGDVMLLPGLVNAHTHLDLTVMRGLLTGLRFFEWIRTLVAARAQLTPAELLDSARLGVVEGIGAGITTFADTAPSDAPFDAMRELGVRGIAYREVFGPDPAACAASMVQLRSDVAAMRARESALVRVGVSPHAPYSVSEALYAAAAAFAREQGMPLATHVAEGADETELVTNGGGPFAEFLRGRGIAIGARASSPVALLERAGVLGKNALLVHCVRTNGADIARIAARGAGVATCPLSNAWLGHGAAPVGAMRAARVRLGVGSDSMASNAAMDIIEEARRALGVAGGDVDHAGQRAALKLATLGGARALGLDGAIGSLDVGKQADLTALPLQPGSDLLASSRPTAASLVVIAGRVLVRGGRHVLHDDALAARVALTAARLREWRHHQRGDAARR